MINNKTYGTILKSLPPTLTKSENEEWAIASAEVIDREGDIIRSEGISLELHKKDCPIKIVGAAHKANQVLPDGSYPIMGVAKEFMVIQHKAGNKEFPALAVRFEYDTDDANQITPYAAKMKSLYRRGRLDSFSVGIDPVEHVPLKGGRYDVRKSRLFEISGCLVPTNPYTTILKSLRDELGDDFDALQVIEERMIQMQAVSDSRIAEALSAITKAFDKRFDDYESAAASKSVKRSLTGSRSESELDELRKQIEQISAKL